MQSGGAGRTNHSHVCRTDLAIGKFVEGFVLNVYVYRTLPSYHVNLRPREGNTAKRRRCFYRVAAVDVGMMVVFADGLLIST